MRKECIAKLPCKCSNPPYLNLIFTLQNLEEASLQDVHFHRVHPNALNGSGSSLTAIILQNCSFTKVLNLDWKQAVSLQYLTLGDLNTKQFNMSSMKGLLKLDTLQLKGMNMTAIEDNAFEDSKNLRYLSVVDCSLDSVTWLQTLRMLSKLVISASPFSKLTHETFIPPVSIEKIYIKRCSLRSVPMIMVNQTRSGGGAIQRTDFCCRNDTQPLNYDKLTVLYLDFNEIKISPGGFRFLHSLKSLYLRHNNINHLPAESFVGLQNLRFLFLNSNNISFLPQSLFRPLHNIISLFLSENNIQSLESVCSFTEYLPLNYSSSAFTSLELSRLSLLTVRGNYIPLLSNNSFQKCAKLETLYLSDNYINHIEQRAFRHLNKIKTLDLSRNNISSLHLDTFNNLTHLQKLLIHSNLISHIQKGLLDTLGNLRYLLAVNNMISSIEVGALMPLSQLIYLDLDNNMIRDLQENTFAGLYNLANLLLNKNQITFLPKGVFQPLPSLKMLYLNFNKIRHIVPGTFMSLHSLQTLSLENNQLHTLITEMFTVPSYLYLNNNPLECKCDLFWINNIKSSRIGSGFQRTQCTNQPGMSIFKVLEEFCCGSHEGACPTMPDHDLISRYNTWDIYVIIGAGAVYIIGGFIFVLLICRKRR